MSNLWKTKISQAQGWSVFGSFSYVSVAKIATAEIVLCRLYASLAYLALELIVPKNLVLHFVKFVYHGLDTNLSQTIEDADA